VSVACGQTGARAAAVELKDALDGTAPGVAVDAMLAVDTLSGSAAGGVVLRRCWNTGQHSSLWYSCRHRSCCS